MKKITRSDVKQFWNEHKKEIAVDTACLVIGVYCGNKLYHAGYNKGSHDMREKFTISINNMVCVHPVLKDHLGLAYELVPAGKMAFNVYEED